MNAGIYLSSATGMVATFMVVDVMLRMRHYKTVLLLFVVAIIMVGKVVGQLAAIELGVTVAPDQYMTLGHMDMVIAFVLGLCAALWRPNPAVEDGDATHE